MLSTILSSNVLFLVSFLVVALGQPMRSGMLSVVASCLGYALFWFGNKSFWRAVVWFGAVQAVQLSWLTETTYMGPGILGVYGFLVVALGLQFGLLTKLVQQPLTWSRMLGAAGLWVWMEWIRLWFLTGFPWNPTGLSLAGNSFSIQFAALFGVYGLSFWVMLTNLAALKDRLRWAVLALTPYAFGLLHQTYWDTPATQHLSVALVQTGLRNEQKDYFPSDPEAFVSPLHQWERILTGLTPHDLIVLPEAALPFGSTREVYPAEMVQQVWKKRFGEEVFVPSKKVSNLFWAKQIASRFGAEVIVGMDAGDKNGKYNAAFHCPPAADSEMLRYEKRKLVPVGEYVPFENLPFVASFVAEQFGIDQSFTPGTEPKTFPGKIPLGITICSEEIYSHLIRETRRAGAELLVNVTNDAWFPGTHLPQLHCLHGQLRAAENGVGLVRSCNTGVTAVIDRFGNVTNKLSVPEFTSGVLSVHVPIQSHTTLYTLCGDSLILALSACFLWGLRKRLPEYRSVN